jgi:protoheme IX farnesyltransferase
MRLRTFLDLVKARIVLLEGLAALAGYLLAGGPTGDPVNAVLELLHLPLLVPLSPDSQLVRTLLGVLLITAGACATNMLIERRTDALMARTKGRPLPTGELSASAALAVGTALSAFGFLFLATVGRAPAALGFLAWVLYVAVYTPLKPLTNFNTIVGAVPGALPPLIGWVAAGSSLSPFAWILFWIVFVWQIPHFLALAWLYRDDYTRGGLRMLPSEDPGGGMVGRQALLYSVALVPLTLAPAVFFGGGSPFILVAAALSLVFAFLSFRFARRQERKTAASLFGFSLVYLPAVFVLFFFAR